MSSVRAVLLNGTEIMVRAPRATVNDVKVQVAGYFSDLSTMSSSSTCSTKTTTVSPVDHCNVLECPCTRFATEVMVLDNGTQNVLTDDTGPAPEQVWAIIEDITFDSPDVWTKTVYAHALAGDADGVRRAAARIGDSRGTVCGEVLLMLSKIDDPKNEEELAQMCELMVELGAYVDVSDEQTHTSLYWASLHGNSHVVAALLKAHADTNKRVLPYLGVGKGSRRYDDGLNIIELNHGYQPYVFQGAGDSPLIAASLGGHIDTVKLLLEYKAEVDASSRTGATALFFATSRGYLELVSVLLEAGSDVNHVDKTGQSVIMGALQCSENLMCVKALIEAGANMNMDSYDGYGPLHWPIRHRHTQTIRLLLEHGADVNHVGLAGYTPLLEAASGDYVDAVHVLLDYGADVNKTTPCNCTPLLIACSEGFADVVDALLKAGAEMDRANNEGETAMSQATYQNHEDVINLLENARRSRSSSTRD